MTTQYAKKELGKIEKVAINDIWTNEPQYFTPWLAENIDMLGDALGLKLKDPQREVSVGTFRLDLLATEVGTGYAVAIENQFGQTDPSHLGRLLVYAANRGAKVAVWVAESFHKEVIVALDLLNNHTGIDTQFFGVRIEAVKIGDSLIAPRFDVVAAPQNTGARQDSERDKKYTEFFQRLIETMENERNFRKVGNTDRYAESFSSSHPGLIYKSSFFTPYGKMHRIELYFDRSDKNVNKEIYDNLYTQKKAIEDEIGESLCWQRLDDGIASRISIRMAGGIDDEEMHDEIRQWMVDRLLKFKKVFGPRLAELAERGIL